MAGHGLELLGASLLALAAGPLVYTLAGRRRSAMVAFQALVVTAIVGLVVVHLLPHCVKAAGWSALVAAAAGLVGPLWLERQLRGVHGHGGRELVLGLALVALALHEMTDGMLLVEGHAQAHGHDHGAGHALGAAVVLHRIPVGGALFCLLRPRGLAIAWLALAGAALASIFGFVVGERLVALLRGPGLAVFQAFGGGLLLHVIIHAHAAPAVAAPRGEA